MFNIGEYFSGIFIRNCRILNGDVVFEGCYLRKYVAYVCYLFDVLVVDG